MLVSKFLFKATVFVTFTALFFSSYTHESFVYQPRYTQNKTYRMTILYSCDCAAGLSRPSGEGSIKARNQRIAAIRSEVESQGGRLLLISGGGISSHLQGSRHSILSQPAYDAMAVSSYMFQYPLEHIKQLQQKTSTPFISANIFESETGKPVFNAYTLIDVEDISIAVIGITAQEYGEQQRKNISGLDITNPGKAISFLVPRLEQQANMTIVANHTGHLNLPDSDNKNRIDQIEGVDLVLEHTGNPLRDNAGLSESKSPPDCNKLLTRVDILFRNGKIEQLERQPIRL